MGGDQLHDVADAARRARQFVDAGVGTRRLGDCRVGDAARFAHTAGRSPPPTRSARSPPRRRSARWRRPVRTPADTLIDSSWVDFAVRVRVPAEASSSVEADDTASMMRPTASSKLSARPAHGGLAFGGEPGLGRLLVGHFAFGRVPAFPSRASLGFLLLGFELFHAHDIVAEGLGGARHVADFVARARHRGYRRTCRPRTASSTHVADAREWNGRCRTGATRKAIVSAISTPMAMIR